MVGAFLLPGACCLVLLLAQAADAQSYSLDWFKISGGGGTSTGGVYSISGTIGQHDAGVAMSGGSYSLIGGFWAFISVVQTPGVPTLFITHSGNTATVFWRDVSGWNLQQNNNLTNSNGWSVSGDVISANGTNFVSITPPEGNRFYRLVKP